MPKKKRAFIDKKNATTFHLIRARAAQDDRKSNLLPSHKNRNGILPEEFPTDLIWGNQPLEVEEEDSRARFNPWQKDEIVGLVHDYDYEQHLIEMGSFKSLTILFHPSRTFFIIHINPTKYHSIYLFPSLSLSLSLLNKNKTNP